MNEDSYFAISLSHWAINRIRVFWYLKKISYSIEKQVPVRHKIESVYNLMIHMEN